MPHPSYLAVTVEVIDGVSDDVEREEAKNDERNRKPKVDELLHNKENDCCDAKNNRTSPQVLQRKTSLLLQLFEFSFVRHVSV